MNRDVGSWDYGSWDYRRYRYDRSLDLLVTLVPKGPLNEVGRAWVRGSKNAGDVPWYLRRPVPEHVAYLMLRRRLEGRAAWEFIINWFCKVQEALVYRPKVKLAEDLSPLGIGPDFEQHLDRCFMDVTGA